MSTNKHKAWHGLSRGEVAIVKKIRESVPKVTIKSSSIRWWQVHLWKYRKSQVPCIGIKFAIEIVKMVREELKRVG